MRKETLRRGTAAYRLAKAQGRLPSQKKAKKNQGEVKDTTEDTPTEKKKKEDKNQLKDSS